MIDIRLDAEERAALIESMAAVGFEKKGGEHRKYSDASNTSRRHYRRVAAAMLAELEGFGGSR